MTTMLYFIDESGNFRPHNSTKNNAGEQFCTLTAVAIEEPEYKQFKKNLELLKAKYNKYIGEHEIKSHWIRRSKPSGVNQEDPPVYDFWKYGDEGKTEYTNFCNELESIVVGTNFKVISVTVNKAIAQSLYPHKDILSTMLSDLWERIFICHVICKIQKSRILFDPQMSLTDEILKETYKTFIKSGSWFIKAEHVAKVNLYKNIFSPDSEKSAGIQLADYCAYPIKRYMQDKKYPFFKRVIEPKLHNSARDTARRKSIIMGIKMCLSR